MSEQLDQEIRTLQSLYWSERDPEGLAFAPLADAFLQKGDVKEALDLLTDGMSRHPGYATGHVIATRLYHEQGMHSEAEFAARRVLELDAQNIGALCTLASVLAERGETEEAAQLQATLLDVDPEAEESKRIGDLLSDVGDAEGFVPLAIDLAPPGAGGEDEGFGASPSAAAGEDVDDSVAVADGGEVETLSDMVDPPAAEGEFSGSAPVNRESGGLSLEAPEIEDAPEAAGSEEDFEPSDLGVTVPDSEIEFEVADSGSLALSPEPEVEAMDLGALAPDPEPEVELMDLGALAPDPEPEVELMDLGALAPDPEPEVEAMDLGALAPDPEPEVEAMDLGALAPDPEPEVEAMDLGALAPDPEPELEAMDLGALAPDPEPEVEAMDLGALAPDPEPELEAMDLGAFAPDPEPEVEAMDLGALAPDPEPELEAMDLGPLAPDPEPAVEAMDLGALAPDPDDGGAALDLGLLAPDVPASLPEVRQEKDLETDTDEPVYTRTLAELYVRQGFSDQALAVYRHLLAAEPGASDIEQRIAELGRGGGVAGAGGDAAASDDNRAVSEAAPADPVEEEEEEEVEALARDLADSGNGAHDVDTPFAWTEDEASTPEDPVDEGPEIGDYFDNLLGWESQEDS